MAKKNSEQMQMEQPDKQPGFFQKFFFWFIIPLVFCIAILLIFTLVTKKNVFDYIDEIPFISSKEEDVGPTVTQTEQKLVSVQAELTEKEAEIMQLQAQFDSKEVENHQLMQEIERLQYEIEKLKISQEETTKEFKDILTTFEKMSAKKAAPILVQMDDTEAIRILSNMKPDTLKDILEKMTPEQAAKYTQLLTN